MPSLSDVTRGGFAVRVGPSPSRHNVDMHRTHLPMALAAERSCLSTCEEDLYENPILQSQSSTAPKAVLFTGQGNDVVTASSVAEALAIMRRQMFDALVVDCAEDTLDLLNFTAKAQSLQPSLAVFLAGDRGDELVTGLQEFGGVMTMLQNDECASPVVSGWIP